MAGEGKGKDKKRQQGGLRGAVNTAKADKRPDLPLYGYRRQGGRISPQGELLAR